MKSMVIIDSSHYGKSMEIVECIKDKVMDLIDALSYAEMGEKSHDRYREEEDEEKYYKDYYGERSGSGSMGGMRRMPRGRFNY